MEIFYDIKIKDFKYFNLITLTFIKDSATNNEWNELFENVEHHLKNINYNYVMIVDISLVNFPGVHILKKCSNLLKTYPHIIDNYCIESSLIISKSMLSKTIINTLFTFYKSRKPVHIKYSFDETYNNVLKTVKEYEKIDNK